PAETLKLATALNNIPKIVVSSRPIEFTWNNTKCIHGRGSVGIKQELERMEGNALIFGSPDLASSLLSEGLINEIHIVTQPFVGVVGPRAYSDLLKRVELTLLGVDSFKSGSVLIRYNVF